MNTRGVRCPKCGKKMPLVNFNASFAQILWGGWTCPKCGCEMDSWGRVVACCPKCGRAKPRFMIPGSIRQAIRGSWTCNECGCHVDGNGKPVGPLSSQPASHDCEAQSEVKVRLSGVHRVRVA